MTSDVLKLKGTIVSSQAIHQVLLAQVEVQRQKRQRRQQQLESAQRSSSVIWRLLSQGWLRSTYAVADHTRNALILSVFAFKVCCTFHRN